MLSGIKRQGIVGKDGKIEIQTSELAEGTIVDVIVLTSQDAADVQSLPEITEQDTTGYLLSTEANRHHLRLSIQPAESEKLVSFTSEEWNEEHHIHA